MDNSKMKLQINIKRLILILLPIFIISLILERFFNNNLLSLIPISCLLILFVAQLIVSFKDGNMWLGGEVRVYKTVNPITYWMLMGLYVIFALASLFLLLIVLLGK